MPIAIQPSHAELTAGQNEPILSLIQPFSAFPEKIEGPTVWRKEEFVSNPERWQKRWSNEQIRDLEQAFDAFEKSGKPLTDISKETFPLSPSLTSFLLSIRESIVNGPGFTLIQGLPVDEWPIFKSAAIYLAIGQVFGHTLSQNGKGHVLGHVKDIGNDPTQIHKVRIYSTAARQFFHTDAADIVGLLCLHKAKEGGESDVVSAHNVWNAIRAERPDVAELLVKPNWYFDRKAEVSQGQKGWIQKAIFYYHNGRVISHYDPYFVKSIERHVKAGLIPGHSPEQLEAIQVLEDTAQRLALHMVLAVGDIQFVADNVISSVSGYRPPNQKEVGLGHSRTRRSDYEVVFRWMISLLPARWKQNEVEKGWENDVKDYPAPTAAKPWKTMDVFAWVGRATTLGG